MMSIGAATSSLERLRTLRCNRRFRLEFFAPKKICSACRSGPASFVAQMNVEETT